VTEIVATLREPSEGVNAKVVELTGFVGRRYDPTGCPLRGTSARRRANKKSPARRAGSAPRGMALTCRWIDLGVWLDEGYRIPEAKRENDVP